MSRIAVIKGHRIAPDTIRLDQPLPAEATEVNVILDNRPSATSAKASLSALLMSLPLGDRNKDDIDRQIRGERDSWPR